MQALVSSESQPTGSTAESVVVPVVAGFLAVLFTAADEEVDSFLLSDEQPDIPSPAITTPMTMVRTSRIWFPPRRHVPWRTLV